MASVFLNSDAPSLVILRSSLMVPPFRCDDQAEKKRSPPLGRLLFSVVTPSFFFPSIVWPLYGLYVRAWSMAVFSWPDRAKDSFPPSCGDRPFPFFFTVSCDRRRVSRKNVSLFSRERKTMAAPLFSKDVFFFFSSLPGGWFAPVPFMSFEIQPTHFL